MQKVSTKKEISNKELAEKGAMKKKVFIIGIIVVFIVAVVIGALSLKDKEAKKQELVETYTVTFNSNGGTGVESIVITEDEQLKLPKEPTKNGYIFNGWLLNGQPFDESTVIEKDIILEADWIGSDIKTYKVVFIYNNNTKDKEVNVEENTKISKPSDPSKKGYKFIGWFLDKKKYDFNKKINEDIILVAKWEEQKQNNTSSNNNNASSNTDKKENEVKTKKAELSYSCYDSSYKLNGNKCVKMLSVDSTKEHYCESGYSLSGTTCSKRISNTERQKANVSYSCPDNFELMGSKCIYYLSTVALQKYTCETGTLNGTKCESTSTVVHTPNPYGYAAEVCTQYGGHRDQCMCTTEGGTYDSINKKCYKTVKTSTNAKLIYYCTSGLTLNGTKCEQKYENNAIPSYSCPSGYLESGSDCIKTTYSTEKVSAKYKYTCPSGYTLLNDTCKKEFSIDANKEYTCPKNYTLNGNTCYSN